MGPRLVSRLEETWPAQACGGGRRAPARPRSFLVSPTPPKNIHGAPAASRPAMGSRPAASPDNGPCLQPPGVRAAHYGTSERRGPPLTSLSESAAARVEPQHPPPPDAAQAHIRASEGRLGHRLRRWRFCRSAGPAVRHGGRHRFRPCAGRSPRLRCATLPNVRVEEANFLTHDSEAGQFDLVTALASFHHAPFEAGAAAVRRILRPGRRMVVLGVWTDRRTAWDVVLNLASTALNLVLRLLRGPDVMMAPAQKPTMTLSELRRAA